MAVVHEGFTGRLMSRRSRGNFGANSNHRPLIFRRTKPRDRLTTFKEKSMAEKTIFKKIIDGEIPADIVYEDDLVLAFRDIAPKAPTHVLVIPRKEIAALSDASPDDESSLGRMLVVARQLGEKLGLSGGYRCVINCGDDGGQEVPHLHLHLLGGRKMTWPPG